MCAASSIIFCRVCFTSPTCQPLPYRCTKRHDCLPPDAKSCLWACQRLFEIVRPSHRCAEMTEFITVHPFLVKEKDVSTLQPMLRACQAQQNALNFQRVHSTIHFISTLRCSLEACVSTSFLATLKNLAKMQRNKQSSQMVACGLSRCSSLLQEPQRRQHAWHSNHQETPLHEFAARPRSMQQSRESTEADLGHSDIKNALRRTLGALERPLPDRGHQLARSCWGFQHQFDTGRQAAG